MRIKVPGNEPLFIYGAAGLVKVTQWCGNMKVSMCGAGEKGELIKTGILNIAVAGR